ncbi:unnamed protein product [Staurois parvus]|uniref:Uncharacterized protein n=1 Tax=Staurois parvus TaxID=386267 RepID=A0ABN9H2A3_9NEOB|nr:unnamed protein product [Staurois parvus]
MVGMDLEPPETRSWLLGASVSGSGQQQQVKSNQGHSRERSGKARVRIGESSKVRDEAGGRYTDIKIQILSRNRGAPTTNVAQAK